MKRTLSMALAAIMIACLILSGCSSGTTSSAGTSSKAPVASGGSTTGKIVIKAANTQPLEHPMHLAFLKFKEIVESKTDEIEIEIYGNSVLGSDSEVTEGVQSGNIQIGTCGTANLSEFTDAFLLFDLPFLFPSAEAAEEVLDGEIGQNILAKLEEKGIKGMHYTELGFRNIFNAIRPVKTMDDLKGLKLRTTSSPIQISYLEALGANPTPVSWGEVYTALQQGALDGIDQDLNLSWTNKIPEVQKYLTLTKCSYFPHVFMINKNFYESLSAENQKIIMDAAKEMAQYERQLIRENEQKMIENMKTDGLEVYELSEDDRAKFVAAVQPVYDKYKDKIGEDLINQVQEIVAAR